jgi:hypothetical protein
MNPSLTDTQIKTIVLVTAAVAIALCALTFANPFHVCQVINFARTGQWTLIPGAGFWTSCGRVIVR